MDTKRGSLCVWLAVATFAVSGCHNSEPDPVLVEHRRKVQQTLELAKEVLSTATEIELYSLKPDELFGPPLEKDPDAEYFDWWKVHGKSLLDSEATLKVTSGLLSDLESNWRKGGDCFEPRHGLRVVYPKGRVDIVICFACHQLWLFDETEERIAYQVGISESLRPLLDSLQDPDA